MLIFWFKLIIMLDAPNRPPNKGRRGFSTGEFNEA